MGQAHFGPELAYAPLPVGKSSKFLPGRSATIRLAVAEAEPLQIQFLSNCYCANNFAHKLKIAWIQRLEQAKVDSHFRANALGWSSLMLGKFGKIKRCLTFAQIRDFVSQRLNPYRAR